jgi:hypothetical protein
MLCYVYQYSYYCLVLIEGTIIQLFALYLSKRLCLLAGGMSNRTEVLAIVPNVNNRWRCQSPESRYRLLPPIMYSH